MCGTPEYMAPERLSERRKSVKLEPSVDVWSFGVLLFELMMGYTPYEYNGEDVESLL
jgi:serine/threonine protein kinase